MSKNKDEDNEKYVTTDNKQKKSEEGEILVLDQMIEQNNNNFLKKLNDYTQSKLFQKIYSKRQRYS